MLRQPLAVDVLKRMCGEPNVIEGPTMDVLGRIFVYRPTKTIGNNARDLQFMT